MANGLSDPVDSVMEKIKTQAKKVSTSLETQGWSPFFNLLKKCDGL